jgi:transcriptional regulator with XRE-family HTH domain
MSPDELRRAMQTLGYRTQADLAGAIGVSRSAVSLWLEGKVGVPRARRHVAAHAGGARGAEY